MEDHFRQNWDFFYILQLERKLRNINVAETMLQVVFHPVRLVKCTFLGKKVEKVETLRKKSFALQLFPFVKLKQIDYY